MKRFLCVVLAVLLSLSVAFAYPVPPNTEVYIARTGTKYHRAGCTYLKSIDRVMTIQQAENYGFTPCSRCDPDVLIGDYVSDWDGEGGDGGGGSGPEPTGTPEPEPTKEPEEKNENGFFAELVEAFMPLVLGFSGMIAVLFVIGLAGTGIEKLIKRFREKRKNGK